MHACLIQSNSIHKRSRGMEQLGAEEGMRGLVWFAKTASVSGGIESACSERGYIILCDVYVMF